LKARHCTQSVTGGKPENDGLHITVTITATLARYMDRRKLKIAGEMGFAALGAAKPDQSSSMNPARL
jgi:hypothetical protein